MSADPLSRLQAISFLASEAGALTAASEAALLTTRTEEGLFYVACLGQFKRGKSTLLNALVGDPILPTGVVPVTSVVTVIRYGTERSARVRFTSGQWQRIEPSALSSFVSEEENPENRKAVVAAEVFLPHALLVSGLCLVDTPGLGSVFEENTATTRSFVPHIDAALVVLGADPPISGEELALVEEVSQSVHHLLFVLNKADRLSEKEREEARYFAERVLARRLGRSVNRILEVSATEALSAGRPTRQLPKLHEALQALARDAGADLVARAQMRGIERLAGRILVVLAEQRDALVRPVEDSERRIEALRQSADETERAAADLGHLFTAEQQRLSEAFTEKRAEFLDRAFPIVRRELETAIAASGESGAALRRSTTSKRECSRAAGSWSSRSRSASAANLMPQSLPSSGHGLSKRRAARPSSRISPGSIRLRAAFRHWRRSGSYRADLDEQPDIFGLERQPSSRAYCGFQAY